jgi:hypothetical protein
MLLVARAGRRRRCRGGCWGYVKGLQLVLPIVALTNIDVCPIALDFYRTEVLTLHSRTPFPVAPCLVRCSYHVRGILIGFSDMVAEMNLLKQVCKMLLNGISTVNRSCVRYDNRVLCVAQRPAAGFPQAPGLFALRSWVPYSH